MKRGLGSIDRADIELFSEDISWATVSKIFTANHYDLVCEKMFHPSTNQPLASVSGTAMCWQEST